MWFNWTEQEGSSVTPAVYNYWSMWRRGKTLKLLVRLVKLVSTVAVYLFSGLKFSGFTGASKHNHLISSIFKQHVLPSIAISHEKKTPLRFSFLLSALLDLQRNAAEQPSGLRWRRKHLDEGVATNLGEASLSYQRKKLGVLAHISLKSGASRRIKWQVCLHFWGIQAKRWLLLEKYCLRWILNCRGTFKVSNPKIQSSNSDWKK